MKAKYIRYASDLHLEQYFGQRAEFLAQTHLDPHERDAESILVLAGDISSKPSQLIEFLNALNGRFSHIIYVPGNHEFYGHEMKEWGDFVAGQLGENSSLHNPKLSFATSNVGVEEIDGVRFIFTTMWADGGSTAFDNAMVGRGLRDFYVVKVKQDNQKEPRRFTVKDMKELHAAQKAEVGAALRSPFSGKTVVITHHMPSYRLCHPRFGSEINGGFASNCEDILAYDHAPDYWIHGHTHDTIDTKLWKTRILCNPKGYFQEYGSSFNTYGPKFIELEEA